MSERLRILKHSGYLLAARLFARLASLPFLLYAAAELGPALFGFFTFTLATVEMISGLGDLGLSRYGARALIRQQENRPRLAGSILVLQLLISAVLVSMALVALAWWAPGSPRAEVLLMGLAAAFLSSFIFTTDTIFTSVESFGLSAAFAVAGRVLYLAGGFTALQLGYSVRAVMAAFAVSLALESLMRMSYTVAKIMPFSFRFSGRQLVKVARGTLPFAVTAVANLIYFRADTIILEAIKGDAEVGIYGVAYSFFSFFVWMPIILTRTLLPGLTSGFADDPRKAAWTHWFWYRLVGLAGVPLAFAMTVLAGPLIGALMPTAYAGSETALQVLMWSIPALMMVSVGYGAMLATDRERAGAFSTVAVAVLVVVLDMVLIPFWGARGAAAAMVLATAAWLGQTHWLLKDQFPARLWPGLALAVGLPVAGGIPMAASAWALLPWGGAAALAVGLIAYGLVLAGAWRLGCFRFNV